jgi:hypothetical protein
VEDEPISTPPLTELLAGMMPPKSASWAASSQIRVFALFYQWNGVALPINSRIRFIAILGSI